MPADQLSSIASHSNSNSFRSSGLSDSLNLVKENSLIEATAGPDGLDDVDTTLLFVLVTSNFARFAAGALDVVDDGPNISPIVRCRFLVDPLVVVAVAVSFPVAEEVMTVSCVSVVVLLVGDSVSMLW